jgi:hypothetical protein
LELLQIFTDIKTSFIPGNHNIYIFLKQLQLMQEKK